MYNPYQNNSNPKHTLGLGKDARLGEPVGFGAKLNKKIRDYNNELKRQIFEAKFKHEYPNLDLPRYIRDRKKGD